MMIYHKLTLVYPTGVRIYLYVAGTPYMHIIGPAEERGSDDLQFQMLPCALSMAGFPIKITLLLACHAGYWVRHKTGRAEIIASLCPPVRLLGDSCDG